ncbi:hypothetical protein GmHk_03G007310 [Glycine max]|nr:hypothetical protein GmHk_03G007310 [Glycine max]
MGTNQNGKRFYQVKVKSLDVTSLKELGRLMGPLQRQAFRKVYEKILDLTAAEVFTEAVVSLAQYYDQPLRCFTFGDFQMVPTIEEFEEILGCPLGGRKPYLFSGFLPSLSKIAAVVGDSAKEWDRMKQTRNSVVGLPRKYLEGKARDMASQEKWGPFADILALLIFRVVLFPNVDSLVDLAAIDAFLAYHHSKESPVVAILADLFDTFDRRCEKNSTRIVCCLPALCVWLISHLFQQDTRHPCPLQSYRSCAEKGRVDWDQHLAETGGSAINWFPRWKEGKEGVLFSCGDYPNVPLIGTRGCINYNPALAIRQLGYPMRGAPTEGSLSPFLVKDLGAQGLKIIQRIHKAWKSPLRKDKELRGIRNGVIGGYHGWLRIHTRGLDWLSKLKVIDEENFEAPEEDEEVRALKLELGKARLAKEKFKVAVTHIRKECTELQEESAATARALEQEIKRARKEEYGREKFRGALWGSNNELKLRREERDRSRVHGMILKEELVACARSKKSLAQHLEATKQSMLAIIGQYKEELNQSMAHEQKLVEDFAQVYAEKEARGRVIDALHQEATMWMDRFALTLNGSQDLPRLLAKAKAMAEVCTAPEEIHGLINYCQHMIDLMAHIIRNQGVQEQMKADLSALKDQMASISKVMLKLQKTIEDKATTTASSTVREAEPVLQPALNPGRDRNTAVFGRRYSPQAYPYGLPPDFTPRATPEDLSQAPTFEIESGLRKGKFKYAANMAPNNNRRAPVGGARKKEGDAHAVSTVPTWMKAPQNIQSSYQPNPPNFLIQAGNSLSTQVKGPPAAERASAQHTAPAAPWPVNNTAPGTTYKYAQHPPPKDKFPHIPMAYSELWPSLLENHLVVAIPGKVLQPPYPKWYDPGAKCAYHSGVPGHNIDSCLPFKYKVRHLISAGWLSFQEEGPNVRTNPLASHGGASVNAVEEDGPLRVKRLGEVATSRRFIYQSLQAACMVSHGGGERDECLFHLGESHDMETCPAVEELLQRLMDWGRLEVSIGGREEPQICMQSEEKKVPLTPKALVISAIMVARVMLRNGFEPGMGLGKDCLGNADVVDIKGNPYKYGLGYEPGMPGRRNVPSRFRADRVWPGRISQCFTSAGMVSKEEVAAIEEEFPQDPPSFVQPCHPDSQVGNWRMISHSVVYTADSIYEGRFFEDPNNEGLTIDFDRDISQTINEEEEEDVLSPELERLVAQEEREMKPHQEETELVNLGTTEEKKEEMAPRKLASKRSRKDKAAEGTSSAPEYDSHRFRSAEHQQRFEAIKGWSFLRERRVQLRDDEYTDFQEEIVRRRWASLVTPMAKFDPDIVLEFYANAWPTEEGIPFDADAIGQFLGYPLVLEEGQECDYGQRRNRSDGFDEEAIAHLLCIPGQDFARTAAGRQVRIMRTNMTTLTQIWMTLLLSNIQPSDHNSDLPLPKCQLVYAILTRMSIHVAQLIADAIYLFAGMAPTRHPLDPDKSNRALGFPALITGLCQSFGVPVTPSKVIRPPITRAFIEKYYTQRQAQGDALQAADAPPPHQAGPAESFDTEQYLRHLVRQQAANHRAHVQTHDCLYQTSLSLQSQGFTSFPCPTPNQFSAEVAWPGDWPETRAGEAPAEAPDEADEAREDEEMTDLLDFLGGSGAT